MSHFTLVWAKRKDSILPPSIAEPRKTGGVYLENQRELRIINRGFHLVADIGPRHLGTIWIENKAGPSAQSAAVCFGWCYRMGSGKYQIDSSDLSSLVLSQRTKGAPDVEALSGTYCLLTYDHRTESLWICTDLWAQQSFYYGSTDQFVIASSRAAVVADLLQRDIDGISYIALLRGTDFPPGRTLFANVWRATCGRALHLDVKNSTARIVQLQPLFQPVERMGFREAVGRFSDVLTRAIPLALGPPDSCVDLTGGNDTRMTAAALAAPQNAEIGKRAIFRVSNPKDHPDCITAHRIADTMGWRLLQHDRQLPVDYSLDGLRQAAVLSDGKFLLPLVLIRLKRESFMPLSSTRLVGSIAGELFRDFCWRHEFYNLGRTHRINYRAMLRHRIWASRGARVLQASRGLLTQDDHDQLLLQPYRDAEKKLPDVTNVYKLDRFYHYKKFHSTYTWTISDYRAMAFPYHCQEIAGVAMSIPWRWRLGRRLITTGIKQLAPQLAAIPSDKGAPMEPLTFRNLNQYVGWMLADAHSAYVRHFGKKKFAPPRPVPTAVDPLTLDLVAESAAARDLYEADPFISDIRRRSGQGLSKLEFWEFEALLLVEMLHQVYPRVSPNLNFTSADAAIADSEINL